MPLHKMAHRGFSLIETLIASAVVAIALVGVGRFYSSGQNLFSKARDAEVGRSLVRQLEKSLESPPVLLASLMASGGNALSCLKVTSAGALDWSRQGEITCQSGQQQMIRLVDTNLTPLDGGFDRTGRPCTSSGCVWSLITTVTPQCPSGQASCALAESFVFDVGAWPWTKNPAQKLLDKSSPTVQSQSLMPALDLTSAARRNCADKPRAAAWDTPLLTGFDAWGWPLCEMRTSTFASSNAQFDCRSDGAVLVGYELGRPKCINISLVNCGQKVFAGLNFDLSKGPLGPVCQ